MLGYLLRYNSSSVNNTIFALDINVDILFLVVACNSSIVQIDI